MASFEDINHDSGAPISNHWTKSVTDTSSRLSIAGAAALGGSSNGLQDSFSTGDSAATIIEATTAPGTNEFRLRFRYDPNSPPSPSAVDRTLLDFRIREVAGTYAAFLANVTITITTGGTLEAAFNYGDDSTTSSIGSAITISDEPHCFEMRVKRATGAATNDGEVESFIDGASQDSGTGIDNFDHFAAIDEVWAQFPALEAAQNGTVHYLDEVILDDDGSTGLCTLGYGFIQSSGGLAKYALAVSADGNNVFIALEDNASGNQIVFKATRPSSPTVTAIYEPGGGSAANVIPTGDPDKMIFCGNFGTDVGVILHTISADTEGDISPSSIGTDKIQPVAIDPSDVNHLVAINQADQDALETEDGSTWSTLNAALGQTPVAMGIIWLGALFPLGGFIGGNDGTDENLTYTPNEFANLREDTSAALKAVGAITGIDLVVS